MRASTIRKAFRRSWARVRTLFADRRGNSDLTTYMLLTAAGAAMVGLTLPSLFSSSDSAARTFKNQVNVLERGANPGGGGGGADGAGSGSGWTFSVGKDGANVSGPGGISGSVGSGGVSGSVGGGGSGASGGSGGSGTGSLNISGSGPQQRLQQMEQNLKPQSENLLH